MKEKIKEYKLDVTLSAIITLVVGVIFIIFPDSVAVTFARIIGVLLLIVALGLIVSKAIDTSGRGIGIVVAVLIAVLGVWIIMKPTLATMIIPMAIGVILVVHGLQDFALAFDSRKRKATRWWTAILYALASIALGALCIADAFGIVKLGMRIIGILMVVDAVTDMIVVVKSNKARDVVDAESYSERDVEDYDTNTVDSTAKEVDE